MHIPFCVSLCPYCEFVVYAGADARGPRNRVQTFVRALLTEIQLRGRAAAETWPDRPPLTSVYLGGGTPSLLPAGDVEAILGQVCDSYGVTPDAEITLEANPGPAERGDLAAAAAAGVTRVSFGAQSFEPGELKRLGRRHGPKDIAEAVQIARRAGVPSISLDLLYDVPGQTEASWSASVEQAIDLEPDHLSLYALTLADATADGLTDPQHGDHLAPTAGAVRWRANARREQDDDRAATQYRHATDRLAKIGWRAYEISNWARPGHESRHNLAYWRRSAYDAVGPGAHGFDGRIRRWNAARLDGYVASLARRELPPGGHEWIDDATAEAETVILALRTDEGVHAELLPGRFVETLNWAVDNGLATRLDDGVFRLTTTGRLLSNEVFARLL